MLKKMIVAVTLIVAIVSFSSAPAFAAWFMDATVEQAASINGQVRLTLVHGTTKFVKYVNATYQKEILAVALTAASSGALVDAYHDTAADKITMLVMKSTAQQTLSSRIARTAFLTILRTKNGPSRDGPFFVLGLSQQPVELTAFPSISLPR